MVYRIFHAFRLSLCFLTVLYTLPTTPAESTEQDFLFLETERALREDPGSPRTIGRLFAKGEYLFDMAHYEEARDYFLKAAEKPAPAIQSFLAKVYLADISQQRTGGKEAAELRELKKELAGRSFFTMSGKTKKQAWESPLQYHYNVVESVDRIEIYRNGALFYVVLLP